MKEGDSRITVQRFDQQGDKVPANAKQVLYINSDKEVEIMDFQILSDV